MNLGEAQVSMDETNGGRLLEWKLTTVDPQERSTSSWRSGVRSAMRAASQLPGKRHTDVDDAPCTCMIIKNPIMMIL